MRGDTAGPAMAATAATANGDGPRARRGQAETPIQPGTTRPAAEAMTDEPPNAPGAAPGPRPRAGLRPVRRDDAAHGLVLHVLELRKQHRLRVRRATFAALAACVGLAACGGDDEPAAGTTATDAETAAQTDTAQTETDTADTGTTVALADLRSCLDDAGLEYTEEEDNTQGGGVPEGRAGRGPVRGSLGRRRLRLLRPRARVQCEAGAEEAAELHTGSRFQTGRVEGNVYTGYNTELEKVPETEGGEVFVYCVQGGSLGLR